MLISGHRTPHGQLSKKKSSNDRPGISTQLLVIRCVSMRRTSSLLAPPLSYNFQQGGRGGGGLSWVPDGKLVAYKKQHLIKIFNFITLQ